MTFIEFVRSIFESPSIVIFGAITLIEVAPIKINPWRALLKWVGKAINGDLQAQIADLETKVNSLKTELNELKADCESNNTANMRWEILNFVNTCRQGIRHSKDEWRHAMEQLADYEDYTERKGISNGVIEEDSLYLRELYHKCNTENDFI